MKARSKITKVTLKSLIHPENTDKPGILWDLEPRGFGVRYNPGTGHGSFIVKHRNTVRVVGSVDTLSIEHARTEAKEMLVELRRGIDRRAIAKAEQRAREEDRTFGYVLTDYCRRGRIKPETAAFYTAVSKRQLADWWDRPLRSITGAAVLDRYEAVITAVASAGRGGNGTGTANIVSRIISRVWNHGIALGIDGLGLNPVNVLKGDQRRKMEPRADHVPLDRLKAFHEALGKLPIWADPDRPVDDYPAADALRLILFTGLRKKNGRTMKWEHVDFERKLIRIPAAEMKGNRRLDLPMNGLVEDVLRRRLERRKYYSTDCPWLFPSEGGRTYVHDLAAPLRDAVRLAGIGHVTIHGLRRTYASACYAAGLSIEQTAFLLSHSKPANVTAGYIIEAIQKSMPKLVATVGNFMAEAIGLKPSGGNVVSLRAVEPETKSAAVPAVGQVPATA